MTACRPRVELADLPSMEAEIRRRSFAFNRRPGDRNNRGRIQVAGVGGGGASALNFASLLTSPLQSVQTDLGLTYGTTPLASGTAPPVVTLSGSLLKDGAVPLWFKCTTLGVIGAGAVFEAYVDGLGVTPIMSGITPTAGAPIAITGSAVLSGISVAWAAGTAALDNVWKARCAGLQDQSGNGLHYTQATVGLQPVIGIGLNGKASLVFGNASTMFLTSSLNLATPVTQFMALRRNNWTNNQRISSAHSADNLAVLFDFSSTPTLSMFSGSVANSNTNLVVGSYAALEASWTNSTSDFLRCGSAAAVTGANAGVVSGTGRRIGASPSSTSMGADFLMTAYYAPQSTVALRAALNTVAGYGVGSILA